MTRPRARRDRAARAVAARPVVAPVAALLLAGGVLAPPAQAQRFDCETTGDRRHLALELPGEAHHCEVVVTRLDTGERRVVWYADNGSAFCADKLGELVGKYEGDWGFECSRWPDASGVAALGPARRAALDERLRRRQATLGDGARVVGVRVATPSGGPRGGGDGFEATELVVRGADGAVRTELTLERDGRTVARTEDLAAGLAAGDRGVDDAWVDALAPDGSLSVATALVSGGAACRGAQTLRPDADGALVPSTPHRFSCATSRGGDAAGDESR